MKTMNKNGKYSPPKINLIVIQLESGLATGSTIVKPQNSSDVMTEWESGVDQSLTFSWE